MSIYPHAQFLISAASAEQFPPDQGTEVAIAGRSNAGKSSAINAITARRALARTSKTPGRTRLLNFFELAPGKRLVDLPGYGFAEGSPVERDTWARLIDALALRESLIGLLLVVDARRGLLPGDGEFLAWADQHRRRVHVLLSKADQLKRQEATALLGRAQQQLTGCATVQLFSARAGQGIEAARATIDDWLTPTP
ncbi:MAG TPA: ribosome biogenesis GTP-binding protein YihA/YsxC [Steroidobacteraceae bacterium]